MKGDLMVSPDVRKAPLLSNISPKTMTSLQTVTIGVLSLDVDAIERIESELDSFIEKRAREKEEANLIEAAWAASTRRFNERRRERNRNLWRAYHLERAECLERTAAELAAAHRSRTEALLEEPGEVAS